MRLCDIWIIRTPAQVESGGTARDFRTDTTQAKNPELFLGHLRWCFAFPYVVPLVIQKMEYSLGMQQDGP